MTSYVASLLGSRAKRPRQRRLDRGSAGFAWTLPAVVLVGIVTLAPIASVVLASLTDRTVGNDGEFIGLGNYADLASDPLFWSSLRNNLVLTLNVPLSVVIGLVLAGILFRGVRFSGFFEVVLFLPFLISVASTSVIFLFLLQLHGPVNSGLEALGLDFLARPWLTRSETATLSVLAVMLWQKIGFVVVLFYARLLSLDTEVLEAAAVDGASFWQAYRKIAVPQLRNVLVFVAILGVIDAFAFAFNYVFVLTSGGPLEASYELGFLLFQTQFRQLLIGKASAIAVVLVIVALVFGMYRVYDARREGLR
jgi:ABC-type sugar transport system permease subunit